MRYPASEKIEIIRIVEQSHLPARKTLEQIGVPRATFYRWYDQYQVGGSEALEDRPSQPSRVWNRIPNEVRSQIIALALEQSELSPRELAVRFTDTQGYFVSEATVYRLLKAHDLITSPAFIVMKAANEFQDKPHLPFGISLIGRLREPLNRQPVTLPDSRAGRIHQAEDRFGLGLTFLGCQFELFFEFVGRFRLGGMKQFSDTRLDGLRHFTRDIGCRATGSTAA